jgi:ABC-2 type transport system permease protein
VVTLPLIMLGCVYFPWSALTHIPWLRFAVLFNPMVYVNEGLRAALTPEIGYLPPAAFLTALVGSTAVLLVLSIRVFARRVTG